MIEDYLALAGRIRQELDDLVEVAKRAERAVEAGRQRPEDQDLYIDSAVLNLHDFYTGLERTLDEFLRFRHVVRNIYAFHFDPERIERLVTQMQPALEQARTELLQFVSFLERVGGSHS